MADVSLAEPLPHAVTEKQARRVLGRRALLFPVLMIGVVALVALIVVSIALGAADINPQTVYDALFHFDNASFPHLIIQTVRLPRVLAGVLVGAALAVAGALMQAVTRNPLADPGLLGISAGASFAVVLMASISEGSSLNNTLVAAFVGGTIAAAVVYTLGSLGRGGATPLKLTLAGAVVGALISSFTTAILVLDEDALEKVRFWTAGSLAGREMDVVVGLAPLIGVGLLMAFFMARQLTTLTLGQDVAAGLGLQVGKVRLGAAAIVVVLSGGAVALAGPVGFVGLVVPHIARLFAGADYRWLVPFSAVMGAMLVTGGDIGARLLIKPQELPVGVVMGLIGGPFFILLARWKVKK